MRRKHFDYPDSRLEKIGGWIRVRDVGNMITLAYKQLVERMFYGTKKISVTVDNFDATCDLFVTIGFQKHLLSGNNGKTLFLKASKMRIRPMMM